MAFHYVV